jgi:hypothetical protein
VAEPTLEELRVNALKALTTPEEVQQEEPAAEEKPEPPRDEKGRFTKADAPAEEDEDVEVVYERVIDLGDGSGTQVFRGKTYDELIDNLAKAQENATRKIRELSAAQKAATKVVDEAEGLTEDERFLLSQKILTDPASVIDMFVDKAFKKRVEPRLKPVEDVARETRETKVATDWVASTPDYYACESNGKKIQKYLETQGKDITRENLQAAFEDLNADGLLVAKPAEKQDAESDTDKTGTRIGTTVATSVIKRKVVGALPAKRQAQADVKASEHTEEDPSKLSTERLRELAYKAVLAQR